MFPTWHSGSLSWVLFVHAAAMLLVSLPFAWVVRRLYREFGVWVSAALALVICSAVEGPVAADMLVNSPLLIKVTWLADVLLLLLILPSLVWLVRRVPSNIGGGHERLPLNSGR